MIDKNANITNRHQSSNLLTLSFSHFTLLCSHILNVNWIHRLYQNNPGQVNIWVCISYSVNSNAHTTPIIIYGEPYANKFCGVYIFWNIIRRQVISPVAKFHHVLGLVSYDSASVIGFYQMCLSQSESTILHESIIICK